MSNDEEKYEEQVFNRDDNPIIIRRKKGRDIELLWDETETIRPLPQSPFVRMNDSDSSQDRPLKRNHVMRFYFDVHLYVQEDGTTVKIRHVTEL